MFKAQAQKLNLLVSNKQAWKALEDYLQEQINQTYQVLGTAKGLLESQQLPGLGVHDRCDISFGPHPHERFSGLHEVAERLLFLRTRVLFRRLKVGEALGANQ